MPRSVQATDPSGTVEVTLGPDGLPASFEVGEGWSANLHPTALGGAVTAAYRAAMARRLAAWSQVWQEIDLPSADEPAPSEPAQQFQAPPQPASPTRPRDVSELLTDLLALTDDLDALTEPRLRQATGLAASGMLTLTLGSDGTLSCEVDQAWASDKSGGELTAALNTALAAARQELTEAANGSPADRAARLLEEAAAILRGQS